MSVILKASNISKQYRLGLVGTGTIRHDFNRWWSGMRGKEDPYLKVGAVNDRSTKADSDYVWALKDINFEVQRGEVLGIIGKNGAGKSTLLKILSRVTIPTTGEIKTKGRIASLLEVGTGFHPELTGRENIYLNGAILGMSKAEIKAKEDEIIEFSGCQMYVDTPVKRYSSGMTVRLAFAVAAHLEPDILVIDEVLAVGDAEFQKKAIGKMQDISKGDGRTVLFVSHNMAAVRNLCTRAVVLEYGNTVYSGTTDKAVDFYLQLGNNELNGFYDNLHSNSESDVLSVEVIDVKNLRTTTFNFDSQIKFKIFIRLHELFLKSAVLSFRVLNQNEFAIFSSIQILREKVSKSGEYSFIIEIPKAALVPGIYKLNVGFHVPNQLIIKKIENAVSFEIEETGTDLHQFQGNDVGCVMLDCKWGLEQ